MRNLNLGKILVTGGAGFIGSHVVEHLLQRGAAVAVVDDLDDFYPPARKRCNLQEIKAAGEFRFWQVDIRDSHGLAQVFEAERPRAVIHLAARPGVRPSREDPKLYENINVLGTLNLLEVARPYGIEKFLFASSSSVYRPHDSAWAKPFTEEATPLGPLSPYGASKAAGEMFCHTYAQLYGFSLACLRIFTTYGPRQRPDLAIHKFARLIEQGQEIPIFGEGTSCRDYTYIDDVVAGILAALEMPFRSETINLGSAEPVELDRMISLLEQALGKPARRRYLAAEPADMPRTCASLEKASRLLGYSPRVKLEEGLRRFVAWFRRPEQGSSQAGA